MQHPLYRNAWREKSYVHRAELHFMVGIVSSWRAGAEGRRTSQLQWLLPEVSPVLFFSLGPKHILGNSPTLTVVCCSSPSLSHKFFVISKTGTSLVTHELLALGFHSGFYRSRNTKCASYKQKQKRGKRPSPRARWVSAHTSVLSRLKPSCASVLHPT